MIIFNQLKVDSGLSFVPKPSKYPAMEENTTLIAKPAFVISLKSSTVCLIENLEVVAFIYDFKTAANVLDRK